MKKKGVLIIISGFSGAGKGTIVKKLVESNLFSLSISATSRKARSYEVEGEHYFFIEKNEFEEMIKNKELIEWAIYCDNYYGTPKKYVEETISQGKDVILEIEMQGALQVKAKFPDSILVFVTAPTAKDIKQRLINRGTESLEIINKRLEKSYNEIDFIDDYDYVLINNDIEECVKTIRTLIDIEHLRVIRNRDIKERLKKEFYELLKGEN